MKKSDDRTKVEKLLEKARSICDNSPNSELGLLISQANLYMDSAFSIPMPLLGGIQREVEAAEAAKKNECTCDLLLDREGLACEYCRKQIAKEFSVDAMLPF